MRPVTVLCGPGNNGAMALLPPPPCRAGWPVKLALLGSRDKLSGEAAHAANLWKGLWRPSHLRVSKAPVS